VEGTGARSAVSVVPREESGKILEKSFFSKDWPQPDRRVKPFPPSSGQHASAVEEVDGKRRPERRMGGIAKVLDQRGAKMPGDEDQGPGGQDNGRSP